MDEEILVCQDGSRPGEIKRVIGAAAILLACRSDRSSPRQGPRRPRYPPARSCPSHQIHTTDANLNCASNDVMIAIHFSQGYALCAQLSNVDGTPISPTSRYRAGVNRDRTSG